MEKVGFLRYSGRAFQTVGPETENDREPMDSLTDGTGSLLRYDDRRRQLDSYTLLYRITAIYIQYTSPISNFLNTDEKYI